MKKQYIFLRDDVSVEDMLFIHPKLLLMYAFVSDWCFVNQLKFDVTSIYRPPSDGISKSTTHQTYRAFDLSAKGFNTDEIDELLHIVRDKFISIGAISASDGKSRPVVFHDSGHGPHFHFQIRKNL